MRAVLWVPEVANGHLAYKEAARIPLSSNTDAARRGAPRSRRSASANGGRSSPPRVVVALPPDQVLRKTINLPAAVEDNLAQVLAYDLDRHTPFKPEEVCFDARIVGARYRQKGIARRLGRGAQDGRGPSAAASGRLGRGRGRRHARSAQWRSGRTGARSTCLPVARASGGIAAGAVGDLGALGLIVAGLIFATALPVVAEARVRDRAHAAGEPGARAGRRVECAARAARPAHRGLQLRVVEEVRVSERAAIGRGRDQAPCPTTRG